MISAFNVYWFVALACAAVVLFIVIQYFRGFIAFVSGIYKRHASRKRAVERLSNLKREEAQPGVCATPASVEAEPILEHAELPQPEPAASESLHQQANAEAEPILEHAEPPQPEPAASEDLPRQASVEAEPILERAEPPQPEPAASEGLPQHASAEAEPILERAEPPQPEPAASEDLPRQASAEEPPQPEPAASEDLPRQASAEAEPILEHAEPPQPEPAASEDLPQQASAEAEPILEHAELSQPEPAASVDLPHEASVEAESTLEHAELPQPEPAASEGLPQHASAEAEPILERAELFRPEPAASEDLPRQASIETEPQPEPAPSEDLPQQASAEAEPILEHAEPPQPEPAASEDLPRQASIETEPQPEPAASEDLPQQASVEAESTLEHAELPQLGPAANRNSYPAQAYYDGSVANYDESLGIDDENHSVNKSKLNDLTTAETIDSYSSGKQISFGLLADASEQNDAALMTKEGRKSEPRSGMKEARASKGSIGVTIRRVTEGIALAFNVNPVRGALVTGIDENGPAKFSGVELGDIIVKVDGNGIKEWRDLPNIVGDMPAGKEVPVTIIRKGKELMKTVKVAQLDDPDEQASFNSHKRDTSHEMFLAVDRKSESASVDVEGQQQPVSSVPSFAVPAPTRFGKRMDHFSKVSR